MASVGAGGILPLDHLPSGLLQQIMGFLDPPSLLCASAVSTRLHECVLSSLRSIKLFHPTTATCRLLSAYLAKHGQHVSSLQLLCSRYAESTSGLRRICIVGYWVGDLQELPVMPSLQHLELQHLAVGRGVLQAVAAYTQLTQLCICGCRMAGMVDKVDITASDLGGLPHLQHLQLIGCTLHPEFGAVLSVLVKLTHLTLGWQTSGWGVSSPVLQHITCATNLRELWLPVAIKGPAASSTFPSLASLQQLSFLQFKACVAVCPGLPSGLQRLAVCVHDLDLALLTGVAQLKHLELQVCDDCFGSSAATGRASDALLVKLADQTHLTFLKLTAPISAGSAAAYAALTASSQLQHLELVNSHNDYGASWRDILPHLFASVDCSLPQLQLLALRRPGGRRFNRAEAKYCIALPTLGQAVLARAVSCCTSLQHLDITEALSREVQLCSLLHVPNLTALLVSGITDRDAVQVVAQLKHLQQLEVGSGDRDGRITAAGLQHLTALQHLTLLKLTGDGNSSEWPVDVYRDDWSSGEGDSSEYEEEWSDDGAVHDDTADLSTAEQHMDVSPGPDSHSPRPDSGCVEDWQGLGPCSAANSSEARLLYSSGEELSREQTGRDSCRLQASECRLSDACLATIAQITSLRELQLINHVDLTDAGMLELTALKQLTWLEVEGPVALLNEVVPHTEAWLPSNVSGHG